MPNPDPSSARRGPQQRAVGREHVAASRYCDWAHPAIAELVAELVGDLESSREAAVELFRFVRDAIRYEFGPWAVSASATLARGGGSCTNKANLLVALLRAAGIPAAYGVLRVDGRHYFGSIGPEFLTRHASSNSTHIYAAALLGGRWLRCDPSTDCQLASLTSHWCQQTQLVEWDGRSDALDRLDLAHVHADLGLRANIDDLLAKPARNARPERLEVANDYLAFIRTHPPFHSARALIDSYRAELERRHQPERTPR